MNNETPNFRDTELFKAIATAKQYFLYAGLFSLFVNLLMLVPVLYMMSVFQRVVPSGSLPTLGMLTVIMVFLMFSMGGLDWVRSRILVRASNHLEQTLRPRVFEATFKHSLTAGGAGSATSLADLNGLRQYLTGSGLFAFFDAPWFPIYAWVMYLLHPLFGLLAVVAGLMQVVFAYLNEKITHKKLTDANSEAGWVNSYAASNVRNAEVIESMGMMGNIRNRWSQRADKVLGLQSDASDSSGILTATSKTFRTTIQSLAMGMGALLVIRQEISPAMMIGGSLLLGRALAPLDQLLGGWQGFATARSQYNRLAALLERVPAEDEKMSLPAPRGQLSVEQATVIPPGSKTQALKALSFELEAGEVMGVIGPSAAGKSTLARAILGIWRCAAGKVRLDGSDIYIWDRSELGPYLGYLPQDIELFDGSIAENIARFGEVDSEKVVEAAQMAGVHEMVLRFPSGYDTPIGASGGVLSGGQRQRIGLARALYGEPCLVVLDEPNSNLDDVGERELANAIQRLKQQGTTVVIIAHRPAVLNGVDKILVLKDGARMDFGPRDEILAKFVQRANVRPAAAQGSGQ